MAVNFENARALVDRSAQHILEFELRFHQFLQTKFAEEFLEEDAETGEQLHGFRLLEAIPTGLSVIVYDIVNELRSSLDHAVYDACMLLGADDPSQSKFPFADKADDLPRNIAKTRRTKYGPDAGIPPELDDALIALAAHDGEGGDKKLWAFNELRNIKNHRRLVRLELEVTQQNYGPGLIVGGGVAHTREWNETRDHFVYMRALPGTQTHLQVQLGATAVVGEVPYLEGEPAILFFKQFADKANGIIATLEAQTAAILERRG